MSDTATFDQRTLRNVLGTFVTGVTVVTTQDAEGRHYGVTANSFSSVSIDPPLILWSQSRSSSSHPAFRDSDHFVINILADNQVAVSNHFAKSRDDKFENIAFVNGLGGAPILDGCAAHLECRKVAAYPGGDHVVFLGQVERISSRGQCKPLAFGGGRYMVAYAHDLGPVSLDLGGSGLADVEAIRLVSAALPEICEQLGQYTLCLAVWGNRGPTAIRWEPSQNPVSHNLRTGLVMSITRSATGRAFAAFQPEEIMATLIEEDLAASCCDTSEARKQRQQFEAEVEQARAHGFARAAAERTSPFHEVAVNAFSAPIFNAQGRMVMALSLTSPADRLPAARDGIVPITLAKEATTLSQRLGWRVAA
ncbi:flavin reductase [Advenella kashmirensis W13003]|uniref:Flavin reductase n=1 Tax=Advenella kashmirensis W13003 TaxID=1424334 RepID=V8QMR2_9BURK|nr:flavin reductase [Advenella kashmirensis]ETF00598.1 flavin reductase [Advenella kashmirensis W13003]